MPSVIASESFYQPITNRSEQTRRPHLSRPETNGRSPLKVDGGDTSSLCHQASLAVCPTVTNTLSVMPDDFIKLLCFAQMLPDSLSSLFTQVCFFCGSETSRPILYVKECHDTPTPSSYRITSSMTAFNNSFNVRLSHLEHFSSFFFNFFSVSQQRLFVFYFFPFKGT